VHFFLKKFDDLFLVVAHIFGIFEAFGKLGGHNNVTLLNKAGHTSEQSRFFRAKKSTQSKINGGHGSPVPFGYAPEW